MWPLRSGLASWVNSRRVFSFSYSATRLRTASEKPGFSSNNTNKSFPYERIKWVVTPRILREERKDNERYRGNVRTKTRPPCRASPNYGILIPLSALIRVRRRSFVQRRRLVFTRLIYFLHPTRRPLCLPSFTQGRALC